MKKRRLKKWVLPSLAVITTFALVLVIYQIIILSNSSFDGDNKYVIRSLIDNAKPVVSEQTNTMVKPYIGEGVAVSKNFYSKDDSETNQQNSLIFYENIYMQNTGVLYSSDNQFDVVSVLDGTVKNIKEDELLGYVIEIENGDITTIYQSVDNITIAIGDEVEQGKVIATSGNNALSNEKDNCLHFTTYVKGKLTNPESLYDKNLDKIE